MPDSLPSPVVSTTSRAGSTKLVSAIATALAAGIITLAPSLLDTYLVNILIRACFVAIDLAVAFHALGDDALPLVFTGDIVCEEHRLAAGGANGCRHFLAECFAPISGNHLGAVLCKQTRVGFAHAARGAGDQRDLAV